MKTIQDIKSEIKNLYETNPNIHINVKASRSKSLVEMAPAVIKNVYPKFFCIEECSNGHAKRHSIQYAEVLMGNVAIAELNSIDTK